MSSPFAIFRKHQRAMMAVIGVMCMLAFTVLGSVHMAMDGGFVSERRPTVVSTKYGDFSRDDLALMRFRRDRVKEFLIYSFMQLFPAGEQQFALNQISNQVEQIIGPTTDTAVLETQVLADQAQAKGLVVSDESISDFLANITQRMVNGQQFDAALQAMQRPQGQRISKGQIYESLRTELLANRMRNAFLVSLQATPAERWDYYLQLRRRAKIEYAAIPAEQFVAQVKDPSEATLEAFFREHRDAEAVPGSPTPGFKVPHKAAFQFFRADWETFFKPDAITDDAIAAHYDKFKTQRYRYRAGQSVEEERPKIDLPPGTKREPKADAADKAPPADDKAAVEEKADKKAAPKTDEPKSDDPPADKDKPKAEKKETSDASDAQRMFALGDELALADEPAATDAKDTPPAAEDKTPESPAVVTPADADPSKTADEPTGDDIPLSPPTNSMDALQSITSPPPAALAEPYVLSIDVLEGPNPQFEPQWKVEDAIREELARVKATEEIKKLFDRIEEPMRKYASQWAAAKASGKANAPLPTPLDFAAMAAPYEGISADATPLVSAYELGQMEGFGQSTIAGRPIADYCYRAEQLYQILPSQDRDNNQYRFWKKEDEKSHVPELAEVKSDVLQTWKMFQARDLVKQQAETLAATARKKDQSLIEALADQKGLTLGETGFFSWLSREFTGQFDSGAPAELSEVQGVPEVGDNFMRTVFDLSDDEIGVTMNHPQTVGYVVRLVETEPAMVVLRDMFMADETRRTWETAAVRQQRQWFEAWISSQMAMADVVWKEPPNDDREQF